MSMAGNRSSPLQFFSGLWLPVRGFGFVARHGALVALALVPVALTVVGMLGAAAGIAPFVDDLLWAKPDPAAVQGFVATAWAWLARAAWKGSSARVMVIAALVGMVLARIVSAPVMDLLAEKAMQHLGVKAPDGVNAFGALPLSKSIPLSIGRAAVRGGILFAGVALLFALSFIPGAAVVTTPLGALWTALWLFVDTSVYALQWVGDASLDDVKRLVRERPWSAVGFATSVSLLLAVPLVGFFLTPAAVAGACLLVGETARDRAPPPLPVLA